MKKMILTAAVAVLGFAMASAAEIPMKFAPIKDPVTKTSTNTTMAPDGVIIVDNKDGKSGGVNTHVSINQTAPAKIILSGESLCEESLTKSKNPHDYALYIDLTYADGTKAYGKISDFSTDVREWQKKSVVLEEAKAIQQLRIYILYRNQTGKVQFKNLKLEEIK